MFISEEEKKEILSKYDGNTSNEHTKFNVRCLFDDDVSATYLGPNHTLTCKGL